MAAPDPVVAFAEYAQQTVGVPWPTKEDLRVLRSKIEEFFAHYPKLTYRTLCRLADWCKARKKRPTRVWQIINYFRDAWAAGALPELLQPNRSEAVEQRISEALEYETEPTWRARLLGAQGVDARRSAINEWLATRGRLLALEGL